MCFGCVYRFTCQLMKYSEWAKNLTPSQKAAIEQTSDYRGKS